MQQKYLKSPKQFHLLRYGKPILNQTFPGLNHAQAPCPVQVRGQLTSEESDSPGYWRDAQEQRWQLSPSGKQRTALVAGGGHGRGWPAPRRKRVPGWAISCGGAEGSSSLPGQEAQSGLAPGVRKGFHTIFVCAQK